MEGGRLAADACGPRPRRKTAGIAFAYQSVLEPRRFTCWWQQVEPADSYILELMAVIEGIKFLTRLPGRHVFYTDQETLMKQLAGEARITPKIQPLMDEMNAHLDTLRPGQAIEFELVGKHDREQYPLYMVADALSRTARGEQ